MTKILEVRDVEYRHLSKRGLFGKQQSFTLGPISFDMYRGETVALMGNNGAGKSMLAKALVGAIQIDKGEIVLLSEQDDDGSGQTQVKQDGTKKRKRIQDIRLILQHSADSLNPALSVGSILTQTLKLNTDLNESERREKYGPARIRIAVTATRRPKDTRLPHRPAV